MSNYIGKVVDGKYKIDKRLSYSDIFFEKYLAEDSVTGKTVLVSIERRKINQEEELKEFKIQSEQICQLSHPNIFDVHFRDYEEENIYIVTEYIEQLVSLKDYPSRANQQQRRILWRGAVRIAIGILQALQYLHSKDIIHGNINKNSVFIKVDGDKIEDIRLADIGFRALPLEYTHPELQFRERKQMKTDDLFSVGALLYIILTQKEPYPYQGFLKEVFGKKPPIIPPREHNPEIPLKLQYIIMHALEYRFQSAEEMLTSLRELLKSEELTFKDFEMQYAVIQKKAKEYRELREKKKTKEMAQLAEEIISDCNQEMMDALTKAKQGDVESSEKQLQTISELRKDLSAAQEENTALKVREAEYAGRINLMQQETVRISQELSKIQSENELLKESNHKLKILHSADLAELEKSKDEIAGLTESIQDLENKYDDYKTMNTLLKEKMNTLQKEKDVMQEELEQLKLKIQQKPVLFHSIFALDDEEKERVLEEYQKGQT